MICTTAGYNLSGPYYTDIRKGAIDVLEGVIENDSLFALIFTLDEKDDYRDPNVWIKAIASSNPHTLQSSVLWKNCIVAM